MPGPWPLPDDVQELIELRKEVTLLREEVDALQERAWAAEDELQTLRTGINWALLELNEGAEEAARIRAEHPELTLSLREKGWLRAGAPINMNPWRTP